MSANPTPVAPQSSVRKTADPRVPGGYRYTITSEELRWFGEPDKERDSLPCALFKEDYRDARGNSVLVDDDHVLYPWVEVDYSRDDQDRWRRMFAKIEELAPAHDVGDVVKGFRWIRDLGGANKIPALHEMNPDIKKASGFELVPVMGLLSADRFFKLLMEDKFPVTLSVRRAFEENYTPFPDIFHDLAGHGTMFLNDRFSRFVRRIGELGWAFRDRKPLQDMVALLYWYTIEFGLKRETNASGRQELRVYGAGIISSAGETSASVTGAVTPDKGRRGIHRLPFDLKRVLLSHYEYERSQELYFVIDDYEQLTELFDDGHLARVIAKLDADLAAGREQKIPQGRLLASDAPIAI